MHRTEISAILVDVCLNSVAMVNIFGPLKFQIIYVNSLIPNTLLFTRKISHYFIQKWNLYNFGLFGCHSNSLFSLKNSDDIFEFYNPKAPIIYVEIGTVLRTKLKSVHFWPFSVNLVAMATPFAHLKFLLAYLNSPTSETLSYTQTLSP